MVALCKLVGELALLRGRPLTLVVDGIDEARNPTRVITDLLRPLTQLRMETDGRPAVRLLLGVRSPRKYTTVAESEARRPSTSTPTAPSTDLLGLLIRATHSGNLIRTDDVEATMGDIAAYVRALLQAPYEGQGGAEEGRPELLGLDPAQPQLRYQHRSLAAAVAEEVSPSFLDARIAAERLRSMRILPSPDDPPWRRTLRKGTEALLREDLGEVARWHDTPAEHLMTVLRTSAFGQGAGLPWADIWPAAVRALCLTPVADPDAVIRQVMASRLNGYLTAAVEDERTVYRPIHERISETLRYSPQFLLGLPDTDPAERFPEISITATHAQLVWAFGELLPPAPDQPPHPYLRRHLITHVAAAGLVDDLHVPLAFPAMGDERHGPGSPRTPRRLPHRCRVPRRVGPYRSVSGRCRSGGPGRQPPPVPPGHGCRAWCRREHGRDTAPTPLPLRHHTAVEPTAGCPTTSWHVCRPLSPRWCPSPFRTAARSSRRATRVVRCACGTRARERSSACPSGRPRTYAPWPC
ncbi:hypothetical protein GCM10020295_82590 [Streptomyces cinereospinus]